MWAISQRPLDWWTRRALVGLACGLSVALCACSNAGPAADPGEEKGETKPPAGVAGADDDEEVAAKGPIGPRVAKASMVEHPAGVAWVFDGDPSAPTKVEISEAEAQGYTVIDLSNNWVPYIFSEKTVGGDDEAANNYRKMYVGLANNRIDADGERLRGHEKNFLELYGIPPTLEVIHDEWRTAVDEIQPCLDEAGFDPAVFQRFSGVIAYRSSSKGKKDERKAAWLRKSLITKMKKARLDTKDLEAAKDNPKTAKAYASWRELQDQIDVIDHAQRRFRCEKLFNTYGGEGKFKPGVFDNATTHALANFEKQHAVMGWGHFTNDNLPVLGRSQVESVYDRLERVITERVAAGAGILEDGSAADWRGDFRWTDADGAEHPLPDLITEFTAATMTSLGLDDPEKAGKQLAVLSDLQSDGFESLLVAVRLPALPAYYSDDMDFEVVITRGDVWYDFPYAADGRKLAQPRKARPKFTLYTHYRDQKIPLVHWPTTIGSWRLEMFEGAEHYKYKNSDVGDRVWKDIVAGPTWIPPASTPPRELLKRKWKDGGVKLMVNYDEMGPGYASAYGLVAAYHIREVKDEEGNVVKEIDNQIRTHGSVDYMSINRRFSHGCHRLYNMNAVRLFSFILMHREFNREGQMPLGFGRNFEHEDEEYTIKLATRGYRYRLAEPIPVNVTKGRIQGKRKKPIEGYVPKPVIEEEGDTDGGDTDGGDEAGAEPVQSGESAAE
jgi:hypothetical protein